MGIDRADQATSLFGRSIRLIESRNFDQIVSAIAGQATQRVLFCNVYMLMLSREDSQLAAAMDDADWAFTAGAPVAWLQRRVTAQRAQVILARIAQEFQFC